MYETSRGVKVGDMRWTNCRNSYMSQCLNRKVIGLVSGAAASTNIPTMRQGNRGLLAALCLTLALVTVNTPASADSITSAQAQRIV